MRWFGPNLIILMAVLGLSTACMSIAQAAEKKTKAAKNAKKKAPIGKKKADSKKKTSKTSKKDRDEVDAHPAKKLEIIQGLQARISILTDKISYLSSVSKANPKDASLKKQLKNTHDEHKTLKMRWERRRQ